MILSLIIMALVDIIVIVITITDNDRFQLEEWLFDVVVLGFYLATIVFTIINAFKFFKFKITNIIILGTCELLAIIRISLEYMTFTKVLSFIFLITFGIYLSYLILINKKDGFLDDAYEELLKAKELLNQNMINEEEFNLIKRKYLKHL